MQKILQNGEGCQKEGREVIKLGNGKFLKWENCFVKKEKIHFKKTIKDLNNISNFEKMILILLINIVK